MPIGYKVGKVGGVRAAKHPTYATAKGDLRLRLQRLKRPYNLKIFGEGDDWGPDKQLGEVLNRVDTIMGSARIGDRVMIRGAIHMGRKFWIQKVFYSLGKDVVDIAMSQLGVPYVWADEDPKGSPTPGFDCSGLIKWVYSQVNIEFPHQANAIMNDPQVTLYYGMQNLKRGDLLFYNYGRLPAGQADHIGIYAGDGKQVDASTSLDRVVYRDVDTDQLIRFGYVLDVTGPHR